MPERLGSNDSGTPTSTPSEVDLEFISNSKMSAIKLKKRILFQKHWEELLHYIRTKGKNPNKGIGYADSNIRPTSRRIFQVFEYEWQNGHEILELTPTVADEFIENLNEDTIQTRGGEPYEEITKRHFNDALRIYFRFQNRNWSPPVEFEDNGSGFVADYFRSAELDSLLDAALDYKTPPSYSNLSPEERDRWKTHLAQYLGKPKNEITVADWEQLQRSWKIPSLIGVATDIGPRCQLIRDLRSDFIDLENGVIVIPPEVAVKNDEQWENEISSQSVEMLKRWFEQRSNNQNYDESNRVWLNRKGNPYQSKSLNRLLSNLIDESDVTPGGRSFTWHSIRHSVGTYVYARTQDLGFVAEILRHKTLEAARKYAHPTPEAKREVIEDISGGV